MQHKIHHIQVAKEFFEDVTKFKLLVVLITNQNHSDERHRIKLGKALVFVGSEFRL
jgi:hypothetical protein